MAVVDGDEARIRNGMRPLATGTIGSSVPAITRVGCISILPGKEPGGWIDLGLNKNADRFEAHPIRGGDQPNPLRTAGRLRSQMRADSKSRVITSGYWLSVLMAMRCS